MGKINKLHRRLVKKRSEIKTHKKAVDTLLTILAEYGNVNNWKVTDETRDVVKNGIVVGVEQVKQWIGRGSGPDLAQIIVKGVNQE